MTRKSRLLTLANRIILTLTLLGKLVIVLIDLISKVVNYAREVRELRLLVQEREGQADLRPHGSFA